MNPLSSLSHLVLSSIVVCNDHITKEETPTLRKFQSGKRQSVTSGWAKTRIR